MVNSGWRSVIIEKDAKLRLEQGCLVVESDTPMEIPLCEIKTVLINNQRSHITTRLITEMINAKIKVVFCDEKYNPQSELVPYSANCQTAGRLAEQVLWKQEDKDVMWQKIVQAKIAMQREHLLLLGIADADDLMEAYMEDTMPGDPTKREGQAARLYFNRLFGIGFKRMYGTTDEINSKLNYAYTILLSAVNRIVALYGYHCALGINHCSTFNHFNLSSDLMEPFRVFADYAVIQSGAGALDGEVKVELVRLLYDKIKYDGEKMMMETALEIYIKRTLDNIGNSDYKIGRMEFIHAQ